MVNARSDNLGPIDGRLRACPSSPNCVSSESSDAAHMIEPLHFSGTREAALEKLKAVVGAMPRARVVAATDNYLHVEFRTALFRFVDDVEFLVDAETKRVQVRSASRVGYSDFGVNRRRVELIRAAFEKK